MAFPLLSRLSGMSVKDVEMRYKYFPATFVWQGERVEIEAIRRFWTGARRSLAGQHSELHHFKVSIAQGDFELTHDLRRERWTLTPDSAPGRKVA